VHIEITELNVQKNNSPRSTTLCNNYSYDLMHTERHDVSTSDIRSVVYSDMLKGGPSRPVVPMTEIFLH